MMLEEELKKIITHYKLTHEEIYRHDDKLILISARGIRKIITYEKLNISKRVDFDPGGGVAVTARVEKGNMFTKEYSFYEAVGEARMGLNTVFKFPVAVAEARANGRAVLMCVGLYEKGIIAEAELEFEVEAQAIIDQRKTQVSSAMANLTEVLKKSNKKEKKNES